MSTRSHIGLLLEDGHIESIYCHHDGYLSHNGHILDSFYNDFDKIKELLALGDLSVLGEKLGEKQDFNEFHHRTTKFDDSTCLAYGRDRGEDNVSSQTFDTESEFLDKCKEDFTYLFKEGKWYYRTWNKTLKQLSKKNIEEDKD
jgi:hypothetical protein